MPSQCAVWGRNRLGCTIGSVVCNYSLAGPVAIMWGSQIKVQPQDSAIRLAALCHSIARIRVSHVKWQTGKCEIPDKAQSPKKPWSCGNEESDGVWGLGMLSRQAAETLSASLLFSVCLRMRREVEVFVYLTFLILDLGWSSKPNNAELVDRSLQL